MGYHLPDCAASAACGSLRTMGARANASESAVSAQVPTKNEDVTTEEGAEDMVWQVCRNHDARVIDSPVVERTTRM
jgi:hypothetical protein